MIPSSIRALREDLGFTQTQLAQLLGVHGLTVSKWERGLLRPSPYQVALMQSFHRARAKSPEIGSFVTGLIVAAGVGVALYHLLHAAFADEIEDAIGL